MADTTARLEHRDGGFWVFVPVVLRLPNEAQAFAQGTIVVVSESSEVLRELKRLRDEGKANPEYENLGYLLPAPTKMPRRWEIKWLESSLVKLPSPPREGP
jgi:hypothetical protein